ncbi:hypothetical protein [Mycolicibacterium houstonense]|uniref:hypothetical protein n=1 Tax=Mycolicibacterium houstonense TaxID=146021 RepID=UPI003F975B31
MARTKNLKADFTRPTYHLGKRLAGLATDSLYTFTDGRHVLSPDSDFTITALVTDHPWGISCQVQAVDADGLRHTAAEATAAGPQPSAINSRIRTFVSGPLTWHHAAARITDDEMPIYHSTPTLYVAAGQHHYELLKYVSFDERTNAIRESWYLSIDGRRHPGGFAGPTGASDFVIDAYES